MEKPTVEQMKKRPSLWVSFLSNTEGYLIIVYPDGSNEYMWGYDIAWTKGAFTPSWEWVRDEFKFVSWL